MKCFNCDIDLKEQDKFCSNCGQKVDDNNLRIGVLIHDFFENYVSLDTRFGRSIFPFLFKPGFLTKKFIVGIRKNFANPFRLYILTSILFFSCLSLWYLNQEEFEGSPVTVNNDAGISDLEEVQLNRFNGLDSVPYQILNEKIGAGLKRKFNTFNENEFIEAFNSVSHLNQKRIVQILPDSIQESLLLPTDSILSQDKFRFSFNNNDGRAEIDLDEIDFSIVNRERLNTTYSDEALLDSLRLGEMSDFYRFVSLRVIHVYRSNSKSFTKYIIKNLSLMMLFVLPISAIVLWLVFYRSKMRYVEHLIHGIHLHSFAYFVLGISYLLLYFFSNYVDLNVFKPLVFLVILIHLLVSLKKVYGQSWLKSIIKLFIVLFFYNIVVVFFILMEVLISFLIY